MMNGIDEKRALDEDDFGAKGGIVSAFDAFPKSKPQYVQRTAGGGKWTVVMSIIAFFLFLTEFGRYWNGSENHTFAVEKGIGHELQVNLDVVVRMQCSDLHINVQDAAGDRILAAERLYRDSTTWDRWVDDKGLHKLHQDGGGRINTFSGYTLEEGFGEEHVHDIVAITKRKAKWAKTPKLRGEPDSCRIYGSMDLNKVQGDFHITARGHGYVEFGDHLDHTTFNFSHVVNEFSFGAFYPSLMNPLDRTINLADDNFHKFQYYLSIVPTVYTVGRKRSARHTVMTNQFAVTEQSKSVNDHFVPGIFVKYDIEPVLLLVEETRPGFLQFLLKVVNVLSGVVVAFHWGFTLTSWAKEVWGRRQRSTQGFIGNKSDHDE
ncbi:endoplasmic reticulum vesicle transporter-domain-containing protein [Plectosphaerella cucumerina]|uniref:Endoplasmic reticulum-Golgi intermediate compartment protein n=1 Tax=Plectosphaerella cucumerina TaxID=40658 RepID=A0A8K0TA56_9PEZI|nr:endoplasmic reticulum vesicle transporter-domain-containing protein [Plectosphaerella cucumerina]